MYGRLLYSRPLSLLSIAIHLVNCIFNGVGKAPAGPAALGGGVAGSGVPNIENTKIVWVFFRTGFHSAVRTQYSERYWNNCDDNCRSAPGDGFAGFSDRMSTQLCIGLKKLLIKLDKAECSFT